MGPLWQCREMTYVLMYMCFASTEDTLEHLRNDRLGGGLVGRSPQQRGRHAGEEDSLSDWREWHSGSDSSVVTCCCGRKVEEERRRDTLLGEKGLLG